MLSNMNLPILYTIGHSNHEPAYFADLLRLFGIDGIVDVRSIAANSRYPQFNKAVLRNGQIITCKFDMLSFHPDDPSF